ncbi:Enoyl-CoA hydratase [hydrothermal vent metagenome]|uniref:Enoyl-CoA hydratase n=1 Tax=hydrothermal vent metagenome TaxID=652676 RepID=A0A3B1BX34_9ZZZZ
MTTLHNTNTRSFYCYSQLEFEYSEQQETLWCYMNPRPRPCFNSELLNSLRSMQNTIYELDGKASPYTDDRIAYFIFASKVPGVFNLGGDLNLFQTLIKRKDRDALRAYAHACIDVLYHNIDMPSSITTISLVQGSALGGGFEAALSSSVLVAERSAELGLPEILFNLFPGMGAYSLLARRIGPRLAERLITSGKIYRAEELYEMGVVDVLAEDGHGQAAVEKYIRQHRRSRNGLQAIEKVRQFCDPLNFEELSGIAEIWVDAACRLNSRDLRMMNKLVSAQNHLQNPATEVCAA